MLVRLFYKEWVLLYRLAAAERVTAADLSARLIARALHPAVKEWGGPNNLPTLEEALERQVDE